MPSPFFAIPESDRTASNDLAFAFRDDYPVTPGHTLVVPRREIATWFDANEAEQRAIMDLVAVVTRQLDRELTPMAITSASTRARPPGRPSFTCTCT